MSRQRVPTSAILDLAVTPPKLSQAYLTQTAADARYPLKTDPDPYPIYLTQAEGDARYQTPAQAAALYLPLSGGTLTGPGNLTVSGSLTAATIIPPSNTLAVRNGTNAQTVSIFNTYTDASNYERGFFRWQFGIFETGTDASGSGAVHAYRLSVGGGGDIIFSNNFADRWRIQWQDGALLPWDDASVDAGSSTKRVRDIWLSRKLQIGSANEYIRNPVNSAANLSVESSDGSVFVASKLGTNVGGNLYHDGTNWQRFDVAQPGTVWVLGTAAATLFSATAGANPASVTNVASIDTAGKMVLASYSAQVAMGQYTATTAFNTTAVGTWVETPAQVTATFTGKRIRITGSACLYDSAASIGVYLGVMIDGVANASTAYFYTTGVSVSQTPSFTYYHPGLTGSHRISLCVQQQSAGTLTYNAAVPMLLYVTEERF